jgi:hypothetical protein
LGLSGIGGVQGESGFPTLALRDCRAARTKVSEPVPGRNRRSRVAGASIRNYQLAEIQRLLGEFADAEESYRPASLAGETPSRGSR